jgi:predicted nucleic acid-binding protein
MIVPDASVLANVVGDDGESGAAMRARLISAGAAAVPDVADVEVVSVLRKHWLGGTLSARRFRHAVTDLLDLPLLRFPGGPLMRRAYELRANLTAYDASYVALAEGLGCPLVTTDARLARAPGLRCHVEVVVP